MLRNMSLWPSKIYHTYIVYCKLKAVIMTETYMERVYQLNLHNRTYIVYNIKYKLREKFMTTVTTDSTAWAPYFGHWALYQNYFRDFHQRLAPNVLASLTKKTTPRISSKHYLVNCETLFATLFKTIHRDHSGDPHKSLLKSTDSLIM